MSQKRRSFKVSESSSFFYHLKNSKVILKRAEASNLRDLSDMLHFQRNTHSFFTFSTTHYMSRHSEYHSELLSPLKNYG